jgi:hypothetical protein
MASINTTLASRKLAEQMAESIEPVDSIWYSVWGYDYAMACSGFAEGRYKWLHWGDYTCLADAISNTEGLYEYKIIRCEAIVTEQGLAIKGTFI